MLNKYRFFIVAIVFLILLAASVLLYAISAAIPWEEGTHIGSIGIWVGYIGTLLSVIAGYIDNIINNKKE